MKTLFICFALFCISCSTESNCKYFKITEIVDSNYLPIPSRSKIFYAKVSNLKDSFICHIYDSELKLTKYSSSKKNGIIQLDNSDLENYQYRFLMLDYKTSLIHGEASNQSRIVIESYNTESKVFEFEGKFGGPFNSDLVSWFNGSLGKNGQTYFQKSNTNYSSPARVFKIQTSKKAILLKESEFSLIVK